MRGSDFLRLAGRGRRWSPFWVAGASGVLAALAFPLPGWAGLAWLAPGLLLGTLLGGSGGVAFRLGMLAGFVQFSLSLRWLLNIPFLSGAIAGWLALSVYCSLYSGLWAWLAHYTLQIVSGRSGPLSWSEAAQAVCQTSWGWRAGLWVGLAAAATGLEVVRGRFLSGFPWNFFGVTQWENVPLMQIASVTGVFGVSFLLHWLSFGLLGAVLQIRHRPAHRLAWTADLRLPLAVLLVVLGAGFRRVVQALPSGPAVTLALVQPSIPQTLIWDAEANPQRFATVLDLSATALQSRPEALIWPEGSLPDITEEQFRAVTALTREAGSWWVLGTGYGRLVDDRPEHYNAAILVDPAGQVADRYHKRRLVIFGEFIPFERVLPFMKWLTPIGSSFTPGREAAAFRFGPDREVTASPVICFEDLFPETTRRHVTAETDFLLELTNNGWFGESSAHWQHGAAAAFRAVENGVPVVRCANNGLTGWLDEFGRMRDLLGRGGDVHAAGVLVVSVPRRDGPRTLTWYHRHGDVFGWSCVGVTVLLLVGVGPKRVETVPAKSGRGVREGGRAVGQEGGEREA